MTKLSKYPILTNVNLLLYTRGKFMEDNIRIKAYYTLPEDAVLIRQSVFVEEQGFKEEFDSVDHDAVHLVLYNDGVPAATCRFFKDSKEAGTYIIGRIAVIKAYRGQDFGSLILEKAGQFIKKAGGKKICLHSQKRVKDFYEKQGYHMYGKEDLDEGCPHIWMCKGI